MTEAGTNWIQHVADAVEAHTASTSAKETVVCASGISPSGPVHLGNLREVITTHFVAEELRSRGRTVEHLHSWDDYDRLRKVPAGLDPARFAEHIGRPLAAAPDPCDEHESYASHFIAEFSSSLRQMGIFMHEVRQSERYPRGDYNAGIRRAMDRREQIFDILAAYQTEGLHEKPIAERRREYFPFRPYCAACGRDTTTVSGYQGDTVHYYCRCAHSGTVTLADGRAINGKLVWKVDWPMRWFHEGVAFEPGGEDHSGPGSSYDAACKIVSAVYSSNTPHYVRYAFVGLSGGTGKMSGSAGGAFIPATALDVLEPAMIRWLYARRAPSQGFAIDLRPQAVQRLYDEWDQFLRRGEEGTAPPAEAHLRDVCLRTAAGDVASTTLRVPFRLLGSAADITQANRAQMGRIVAEHLDDAATADSTALLDKMEPRLTCAIHWATRLLPTEERTVIRQDFDATTWTSLDPEARRGVALLVQGMATSWTLDGLTRLLYGIPKVLLGLAEDAAPTPELKKAQRAFFVSIYRLLCNTDTGPRLPTLLLSIGPERARQLLTATVAVPSPVTDG